MRDVDTTAGDVRMLSGRDHAASDEDQAAADQDLAAGSDPALYQRSRLARLNADRGRGEASVMRDEFDRGDAVTDVLRQAARDRAEAAADRARAAADREDAAREREEARRAVAEAERELRAAATDELTGAWTRRFGFAQIVREIERERRTGDRVTVAFLDVDGLKGVNDSEGHAAGDRLLRLAVDTMRAHLRPYDIVVRYGGDEFLCAMPDTGTGAAGERMRAISAALTAESGHSISFGLAEHRPGEGLQELVDRADADMLAHKAISRARRLT